MPDGTDAFTIFNTQYATANAYTAPDKTLYYFTKNDDIYDSLKLLLEMYFTPTFTTLGIEKEKSIIISEINMYKDNPSYRMNIKGVNQLYPNDDYSYPIIGDEESVSNITKEDLYDAYDAFYTPNNSVLCIVGYYDENELFRFIDKVLEGLTIRNTITAEKLKTVTSRLPKKSISIEEAVSQTEAMILLRNDKINNLDPISCEKVLGILEAILNVSSRYYQELYNKKYFENDIDYQVVTFNESSYIMISAPTKKPKAFINSIINKIMSLSKEDIDSILVDVYLKYLKSSSILKLDSIEALGDTLLSLALEDIDYFKALEDIINLSYNDLLEIIDDIRNSSFTSLIFKPKSGNE